MPTLFPRKPQQNTKTILQVAIEYQTRGWQPLPIPRSSKNPGFSDWQKFVSTETDLPNHFNGKPQNIGVLLGSKSNGLTDIDLDSAEAVKIADYFLPKTEAQFGRISKPRSHRLYISDFPKTEKFEYLETIIEIRSTGGQTIFPPSLHEKGENIEWFSNGEPLRINSKDLRRAVALLASACLVSKFWHAGIRHELSLAVSGALLRNGFNSDETKNFISAVCFAANDSEKADRLKSVETTVDNLRNNRNVFGLPKLTDLTEKRLVETISKWLGLTPPLAYIGGAANTNTSQPKDKPEFSDNPKPLDLVLKPIEEIDTDCLPKLLVDWLRPASAVIGCPFDFLVLSAITAAATLVGSRLRVKPLQFSDWFVVPNLYAGLVGLPSTKKTPALDETRKPILELQAKARKEFESLKNDYAIEKRLYEKLCDNTYKSFKGSNSSALKLQLSAHTKPEEPKLKRFETNDVTASKLIQLLADNPNGFLLFRDELTGWLKSLEAEYDKSARAFILELWKGAIAYELARVDGREIQLESGTLSIVGGIQPSKLQRYVSEAYSFDNSDGFLQRFLFAYPDAYKQAQKPTASDYDAMRAGFTEVNRVFQKLAKYDFHGKVVGYNGDVFHAVKFSPAAQIVIDQWKDEIDAEAQKLEIEDEAFSSFLIKLPKNCFAIALIFHCLENIDQSDFPDEISDVTALKAISYTEVLISHARRVFALGENQIFALAQTVIGKLKKGELKQGFTAREFARKQWSGLKTLDTVKDVLGLLIDYGYLKEDLQQGNGRPTARYYFHPSLENEAAENDED
jgi:putative DNA primase/helicase